jgi:DNA repair exonuclease SbcCD nuclease subunit
MLSFRFLHAADLHLDSPLRGLEADAPADRIRGATRQALINLVDLALDEQVAFVLLAGDLYDGDWEDYPTGQFLVAQLARLTRAGIPVYAISGNHDAQSVLTRRLPWPEGAHLFKTDAAHSLQVPGMDVMIHGEGFAQRAVTTNLARHYPAPVPGMINIGLLHTGCGIHADNYAPCTPEELAGHGYDYWALGHVHTRGVLSEHPRWVIFPGNVQGRHINEAGPKGATLVHVQAGRLTPEHRTLDVVRWSRIRVDLAGVDGAEEQGTRLRAALSEASTAAGGRLLAARVELAGATPLHASLSRDPGATREEVRAEVIALGLQDQLWLEKVEVNTRPAVDLDAWRAGSDAAATLLQSVEAPPGENVTDAVKEYAAHMLGRVARLRDALGAGHPAVQAAAGDIPPHLVQRARDLVLARLMEG